MNAGSARLDSLEQAQLGVVLAASRLEDPSIPIPISDDEEDEGGEVPPPKRRRLVGKQPEPEAYAAL